MMYSGNDAKLGAVKQKLHGLEDAEILAIWQHVQDSHFHPDNMFQKYLLEGKITDDEFVDLLAEEVDERKLLSRAVS